MAEIDSQAPAFTCRAAVACRGLAWYPSVVSGAVSYLTHGSHEPNDQGEASTFRILIWPGPGALKEQRAAASHLKPLIYWGLSRRAYG